ncbi:hypothetical protein SLS58_002952 [Diplodia intermedia]|uniref:Protein required for cell viability n=1 Tax=Diplodia intermedia TaxID=856260 RepID=A0ABR3TXY6_9PEZI
MPTLREELDAAREFLAPALKRGNDDVVVRLRSNLDLSSASDDHTLVLRAALDHLLHIHEADIIQQKEAPPANAEGEYDEDSRQTLYGLLDLVAIRGILPSLSPGVAAKRRPRSTIPNLSDATPGSNKDPELLCEIVDGMSKMLENPAAGLASLIRERVLIDVAAGAGELAFAPDSSDDIHHKYEDIFVDIIKKSVLLSKFAHPNPSDAQDRTTGPSLPLEALMQASKLLSSVPSSMDAESYFTALAPQLLAMLDGAEGQELAKAAALVVGSGILGKKALGAPGAIGWRLFAEPILFSIDPPKEQKIKIEGSKPSTPSDTQTLVVEPELRRALSRLVTLLTSRPSPGLTKRFLGRLMLPLWALLDYAKSHPVDRVWKDIPWQLLETFFRLGAGVEQLETLALNLLCDGPPAWTFAPGSDGGIEIRRRERASDHDDAFNVIAQMGSLEQRLATYQELLISNGVEDQDIGDLFVRLSRRWLVPHTILTGGVPKLEAYAEEDPFQSLIIAKLVLAILEKFKDKLATRPENMIELVKQLLDEWNMSSKARRKRAEDLQKPSYTGLRNIVQQPHKQDEGPEQQTIPAEVDSSEILPVALSLLSTLLSAPAFRPTQQTSSTLSAILPILTDLDPGNELPPSVSTTATTLTTRITTLLNIPAPSKPNTRSLAPSSSSNSTLKDQHALRAALADLTSPTPPLRASALGAIARLARARSPALDVPQLTLLLLRTSLPDPDEYVHLHAISTLAALAALDPPLVAGQLLAGAFVDADESLRSQQQQNGGQNDDDGLSLLLDTRLRIGEILGRVASDMQESPSLDDDAYRGATMRKIAAAALRVSSRRGARPHALRARRRAAALEARRNRAAERAWGGPVPSIFSPEAEGEDDDDDDDHDDDAARLLLASKVVAGWSDTGLDEDVRLRALALSVFTTVVREPATLAMLAPADVAAGVDVALGSLALETEERHAVLRRAAVLVVWGLVEAMDKVHEGGGEGVVGEGAGLAPEKWEEVERVVGWVRDRDADAVVKGHAGEVLEALETWRVKKALGVRGDGSLAGRGVGLTEDLGLAELRGLNVNVGGQDGRGQGRGKKLVVEEIE